MKFANALSGFLHRAERKPDPARAAAERLARHSARANSTSS